MKSLGQFCFVALLIVLALVVGISVRQNQNNRIDEWATQQGYTVERSEECVFDRGPYWYADDDDAVYRVVVADNDHQQFVVYVHFGLWGLESSEPQRQ
jgi:hypothetical protein